MGQHPSSSLIWSSYGLHWPSVLLSVVHAKRWPLHCHRILQVLQQDKVSAKFWPNVLDVIWLICGWCENLQLCMEEQKDIILLSLSVRHSIVIVNELQQQQQLVALQGWPVVMRQPATAQVHGPITQPWRIRWRHADVIIWMTSHNVYLYSEINYSKEIGRKLFYSVLWDLKPFPTILLCELIGATYIYGL